MSIPFDAVVDAAKFGTALTVGAVQAGTALKKSPFDKAQQARLDELQKKKEAGQFGLTSKEEQLRAQQLTAPVARAASQLQTRQETALAGAGRVSGADLSRLRQETGRTVAGGAQAARERILSEDVQRGRAQESELRATEAAIEQRRQGKRQEAFGALSQAAGAAGTAAGSPPETFRASRLGGAPVNDQVALQSSLEQSGASPEAIQAVQSIPPGRLTRVLDNVLNGNVSGPEEQALLAALIEANPQGSVLPPGS